MTFPHNTSILKWRFEIQKYSRVTSFSIIPQFNIWLSKERVWHCREMMSCFHSTTLHTILAEWIHNKWGTDLLWRFKCSLCFAYKNDEFVHSNEHVYGSILLNKVENGNQILIIILHIININVSGIPNIEPAVKYTIFFCPRTNDWSRINKQVAKCLIHQHKAFFQSFCFTKDLAFTV